MAMMNKVDRDRLHQLLDYALDTDQDYVIMRFANMDLDWHLRTETYRLRIEKTEKDEDRSQQ